jgi:hypothetical protein
MAHNGGTPRLLAKCGSAVEVLDKQQIEDPALARVKRARTTGHTDSLPAMAPHSSRHDSKTLAGHARPIASWCITSRRPDNRKGESFPISPAPNRLQLVRSLDFSRLST